MTARTTYRERFQESLEEQIAAGGDVPRMVTLVNIYQGADPAARYTAFREWLGNTGLACGLCRTAFSPRVDEVEEEEELRCRWCRSGSSWGLNPARVRVPAQ